VPTARGEGGFASEPLRLIGARSLEDDSDVHERAAESEAFVEQPLAKGTPPHEAGEPEQRRHPAGQSLVRAGRAFKVR